MLHYKDRERKVDIVTMDRVLATDVYERLRAYKPMESVEVVRPGRGGDEITVQDVEQFVPDTTRAAVLIIDVRYQTRAKLRNAYGTMVRRSRPDFHTYCHTVVIGGGPFNVFRPGMAIEAFRNYLLEMRIDYSPAVCFVDPFLHYTFDEMQERALYENNTLPDRIPKNLQKHFKANKLGAEQLRAYFRAADVSETGREGRRRKRQKMLEGLYRRLVHKDFPDHEEELVQTLAKEGCPLLGETLAFNIYPFFFAEWVMDLVRKVDATRSGGQALRRDCRVPGAKSA